MGEVDREYLAMLERQERAEAAAKEAVGQTVEHHESSRAKLELGSGHAADSSGKRLGDLLDARRATLASGGVDTRRIRIPVRGKLVREGNGRKEDNEKIKQAEINKEIFKQKAVEILDEYFAGSKRKNQRGRYRVVVELAGSDKGAAYFSIKLFKSNGRKKEATEEMVITEERSDVALKEFKERLAKQV